MANKKDLNRLIRDAESAGWKVTTGGGGHLHWKSPVCGHKVISAATPSDTRGMSNHKGWLNKHGWNNGTEGGVCVQGG